MEIELQTLRAALSRLLPDFAREYEKLRAENLPPPPASDKNQEAPTPLSRKMVSG